jgi:Double-GTPase 2
MSKAVCSHPKCSFAETAHCFANADPIVSCGNLTLPVAVEKEKKKSADQKNKTIFWTGDFLTPETIRLISASSSPHIIGIVGTAKAAKTSYLGMLYTLLLNGRFPSSFHFSNSYTLTAWERLSFGLRFHQGEVLFPETTPSNPDFHSIYHLGLKNDTGLKDVLFADASGEVFGQWAINANDTNASSVRWIHENASGFILFVDSQALIDRRAEAKENILDIANRLKQDLGKRPVAIVWSKADKISEIRPNIKSSLQEELKNIFGSQSKELEVSNYTFQDPDLKCHENNLAVLNWLMDQMGATSDISFELENPIGSKDTFLNYRK